MRPTQIRPPKVSDLLAARLRRMIATGELNDGDWLPPEAELVTAFGISRPTLREAFRLLEADGLVEIRRGPPGGARVTIPGPERAAGLFGLILTLTGTTLDDVYQARVLIEPPAVRRLAELRDPDSIDTLRQVVDDLQGMVDDVGAFAEASATLHLELVRLGGNHTLTAVVSMLTEIGARHLAMTVSQIRLEPAEHRQNQARALRSYRRLLTLLDGGRAAEAESFWRRHMEAARAVLQLPGTAHQVIDIIR